MDTVGVDGRTDIERFYELIALGGERTQVDFKEAVDLSNKHEELEFVKDAVAMLNYYPGGYIVIGVDNDGRPSARSDENDWRQFDGAALTDKLKKYVDAPFKVITGKIEDGDYECYLVCLMSPIEGYPIPFRKNACDSDNKLIIREGEILRRNGAKNDTISYNQWGEILEQHDKLIREDESRRVNDLIERFTASFIERDKTPPLVVGMSEASLDAALRECFDRDDRKKLLRFARQATSALMTNSADFITIAALGVYAAYYGDKELFEVVVDGLYAYHGTLNYGTHEVEVKKLRILNTIYEIGAAAVRFGEYGWVNSLVNRTYQASKDYGFASWVRECQVLASQTHQFGKHEHGMAISTALAEIREHPVLRPDLPGDCDPDGDDDSKRVYDHVLDSLCGFDYLYCVCVYAAGEGAAGAYPACIYFKPERVNTVIAGVFGNGGKGLHELLPDTDDEDIADGLRRFLRLVASEAMSHSPWVWYDSSGYVSQYLDAHPTRDDARN